jgi:DNA-binding cell septation regulator SpoVG
VILLISCNICLFSLVHVLVDGSSLWTRVVGVEGKNKLFITTPSSRINARFWNSIMWFILNLQRK